MRAAAVRRAVIHAAITDISIGTPFIAGIAPGSLLAGFLVATTAIRQSIAGNGSGPGTDLLGRWRRPIGPVGPIVILMVMIGRIRGGQPSPSGPAVVAVASSGPAADDRKRMVAMLDAGPLHTIRITAMIPLLPTGHAP